MVMVEAMHPPVAGQQGSHDGGLQPQSPVQVVLNRPQNSDPAGLT
jgi:hypothetical protein